MKKYWIFNMISIWLLWAACAQAAEIKIGVVNLQQILTAVQQGKQAEVSAEIEAKQANMMHTAQVLVVELQVLKDDYAASSAALTPQKKRERLTAIAQKKRDIQTEMTKAKAEIQSLQAVDLPLEQIHKTITKYGQENGYTLIVNISAGEMLMDELCYYDPAIDVTAEIQKLLTQ